MVYIHQVIVLMHRSYIIYIHGSLFLKISASDHYSNFIICISTVYLIFFLIRMWLKPNKSSIEIMIVSFVYNMAFLQGISIHLFKQIRNLEVFCISFSDYLVINPSLCPVNFTSELYVKLSSVFIFSSEVLQCPPDNLF